MESSEKLKEDFFQKLRERAEIHTHAAENVLAREVVKAICAKDTIFFINNFLYTYDPRKLAGDFHVPFILYDFQEDVVMWVEQLLKEQRDGLLEKSRDMGVTWTILAVLLKHWLFDESFFALIGSRKEEYVDNRCYSDDTEILTKRGWILFKDVDERKDEFATRNKKTKCFEWQKASNRVQYDYKGKMYHFTSRSLDVLVSPNHRMVYRTNLFGKTNKWERIGRAEDVAKLYRPYLPAVSFWKGNKINKFVIEGDKMELKDYGRGRIYQTKRRRRDLVFTGDDYCAFMGMYLSEGWANKTRVIIAQQKKSKGYKPFQELFVRIFGKEPPRDTIREESSSWSIGRRNLAKYLSQFGKAPKKFIPEAIMDSTPKQIEIFLYYFMLGDGSWRSAQPSIATSSRKMADQLQELIQKVGYSSSITTGEARGSILNGRTIQANGPQYSLRIRTSDYQGTNIRKVDYEGKIWCVSVPNEVLYVRRNGKPIWCGNSIDSSFGKLEYMVKSLPKWILPKHFDLKKNRQHMKLVNPEMNNVLRGESSNKDFGRAGRASIIFMDEFSYFEYAEDAWTSSGDSTRVRLAVGTPNGNNKFKRLRFSKKIDVKSVHWRLHPLKTEEWYKKETLRRTEEEIAQELDISYNKSVTGRVYPQWSEVPTEEFYYNPALPIFTSWDFGRTDDTAIIWWQWDAVSDKHYILDAYWNHGKKIDFYVPFITGNVDESIIHEYSKSDLEVISSHRIWNKTVNFGDPDMLKHFMTSDYSVLEILHAYGIDMLANTYAVRFEERKIAAQKLIPKVILNKNERIEYLSDCMANSHYPERGDNSKSVNEISKPVHSYESHFRSAFEYYAVNISKEYTNSVVKEDLSVLNLY